jgi:hypothetical protein
MLRSGFADAPKGWVILVKSINPITKHQVCHFLVVVEILNVFEPIYPLALTVPMRVTNPEANVAKSGDARIGEFDSLATDREGVGDMLLKLGLDGVLVMADVVFIHWIAAKLM